MSRAGQTKTKKYPKEIELFFYEKPFFRKCLSHAQTVFVVLLDTFFPEAYNERKKLMKNQKARTKKKSVPRNFIRNLKNVLAEVLNNRSLIRKNSLLYSS